MRRILFSIFFVFVLCGTCFAQTVKFHDTFAAGPDPRADNDPLAGTTPDTAGTTWTAILTASTIADVQLPAAFTKPRGNPNNVGLTYEGSYGGAGSADVDVEGDSSGVHDTDSFQPMWLYARYADANNFYAVAITGNSTAKAKLYKIVSGTATLLGTSTNTPTNAASYKLELRGSALKFYEDTGTGYSQEISVTDSALTAAGESGMGWGAIHSQFSTYDVRNGAYWTEFKVTEFTVGGVAFLPPASIF